MKKKSSRSSRHSFALAIVAIAAPLLAAGVVPSYANTPRALQQGHASLFQPKNYDQRSFRIMHRLRNMDETPVQEILKPAAPAKKLRPCDEVEVQEAEIDATEQKHLLLFEELGGEQRETLRRQLRNHACPQNADADYKALCERMLRGQKLETKTGLSNPEQP